MPDSQPHKSVDLDRHERAQRSRKGEPPIATFVPFHLFRVPLPRLHLPVLAQPDDRLLHRLQRGVAGCIAEQALGLGDAAIGAVGEIAVFSLLSEQRSSVHYGG
jgi:hypothetical protein